MKDYKRFTFRQEGEWAIKASNGAMSIIFADDVYYIGKAIDHFADLENKIKRGEIDYVEAKDKKIAQLITERDKWKRRAEVAEQEATVWKDCANKWQKYYKEQAAREIEEERK